MTKKDLMKKMIDGYVIEINEKKYYFDEKTSSFIEEFNGNIYKMTRDDWNVLLELKNEVHRIFTDFLSDFEIIPIASVSNIGHHCPGKKGSFGKLKCALKDGTELSLIYKRND